MERLNTSGFNGIITNYSTKCLTSTKQKLSFTHVYYIGYIYYDITSMCDKYNLHYTNTILSKKISR